MGRAHRHRVGLAAGLLVVALVAALVSGADRDPAAGRPVARWTGRPMLHRVAVLVLENRSYRQVIGNPHAPFLNGLAHRYALATRYYALGHPSLPNYAALISGSAHGLRAHCLGCDVDRRTLVEQLDGAGISWRAYFQSLPRAGYLGGRTHHLYARSARYARLYNPFVYFERVTASSADRDRLVPLSQLAGDLGHHDLPRFTWLAPDLRHDGHNGSIASTDAYVARLMPPLVRELGPRGVLFITWDEGRRPDRAGVDGSRGGGRVALIAAGAAVARHATVTAPATHYSLLATIEEAFGLPRLGHAASPAARPLLGAVLRR